MVTACTVTPLFNALSAFHAAHPGVELSLLEDASDRLIEQVRSGEADLVLTGTTAMPAGLEGFPVISERLVAAVPADHPLTRHKRVTLADLTAHPLVCMPEGSGIRTVFDRGCAARGVRPDIALQASAPDTIADLAARGLGVAILSASMVDDGRGLRGLQIADLDAPALLALVWKATDTPALRELVRTCRAAFA
jgi:DNA-binding transcriptional LysR family regulator